MQEHIIKDTLQPSVDLPVLKGAGKFLRGAGDGRKDVVVYAKQISCQSQLNS